MRKILRGTKKDVLVIKRGAKFVTVSAQYFFRHHFIDSIIRLRRQEYCTISKKWDYITHFNLQPSNHHVGKIYALPLIVTPGYYTLDKEVLPVLSFDDCVVARCVAVKNLSYDNIKKNDFKYSFPTIQNVSQLQKAILQRYGESMPHLSHTQILSIGVAMTTIKIMGTLSEHVKKKQAVQHQG